MMKKNGKQVLFLGGIFIIAFAVWTALIQMVDVQPLGQNGTILDLQHSIAGFIVWQVSI